MQTKTIIQNLSELPTAPTTIGTMAWNQTGDWRYVTPLVADKLAPCSQHCPAGAGVFAHVMQGLFDQQKQVIGQGRRERKLRWSVQTDRQGLLR